MSTRTTPEGPVRTTDGALGPHGLISLHDHLDGALRPATVVELAAQVGHELPTTDPASLGQWFRGSADSGSLPRYLETFAHTVAVMQTAPALRRVAREYVADCAADGLVHAEVRWAPEQHVAGGLTLDQAVDAVQSGLAEGVAEVKAAGGHISVVQILCAMRHLDRSREIAELAVRYRDRGVGGFDIAGAEAGHPPSRHLDAFEYLRRESAHFTIHAGEAFGLPSIWEALQWCGADRLGHGVRIVDDIGFGDGTVTDDPLAANQAAREDPSQLRLGRLAAFVRDTRVLRAARLVERGIRGDHGQGRRRPGPQRLRLGGLTLPVGLHRNGIRLGHVDLTRHQQALGERPTVGGERRADRVDRDEGAHRHP